MLIIEGPDGVGKTTLAKKLLGNFTDRVYAHFTRLPPSFDYYWGYVERMGRRVVQDRFHLSEIAYAQARGETPKLCPETYRLVDGRLRLIGAYMVLVTATEELVRSRWDPTQMYDVEKTVKACQIYNDIARSVGSGRDYHGYWPDVDMIITCSEGSPYVTDDAVDRVLGEYRRRQAAVDHAGSRSPVVL
jgi:thymidylate kinase